MCKGVQVCVTGKARALTLPQTRSQVSPCPPPQLTGLGTTVRAILSSLLHSGCCSILFCLGFLLPVGHDLSPLQFSLPEFSDLPWPAHLLPLLASPPHPASWAVLRRLQRNDWAASLPPRTPAGPTHHTFASAQFADEPVEAEGHEATGLRSSSSKRGLGAEPRSLWL